MLTPSTAPIWTHCALAPQISRGTAPGDGPFVPDDDDKTISEQRREGQAADWVAAGVLRGDADSAVEFLGETAPNGHVVTPDMVTHVQGYVDYCRSRGEIVRVQVPVSIPHLFIRGIADAQTTVNWSTVDGTTEAVLEIIDLKYGWMPVDVEWNGQLLCEAIALFNPQIHDRVIMTIYQPRPYHVDGKVRHWELDEAELTTAYHWLARKATAATSPGAVGTPGAEWCGMCDGRGRCEALSRAVYGIFETVRGYRARKLDAQALGNELTFLDQASALIKAYKSGVTAEVEGRMKRGEYIPGVWWNIRQTDREFTVGPDVIAEKTGLEPFKRVPKSPAELEKEGADPNTIAEITERRFAGVKLAPATAKEFAKLFPKETRK